MAYSCVGVDATIVIYQSNNYINKCIYKIGLGEDRSLKYFCKAYTYKY